MKSIKISILMLIICSLSLNINAQTFVTVYSEDFEKIDVGTQISELGFAWWGNNSTIIESTGNGANASNRFISTNTTSNTVGINKIFSLITTKQYRFTTMVKTENATNHNPLRITRPNNAGNYFNNGQTLGTDSWEIYTTTFTALADEDVDFVTVKVGSGELSYDNIKLEIEGVAWTGAASSDWHDPANWENGVVPTEDDHVYISNVENLPIISSSSVMVQSLELEDNAVLLVQNNFPLIVSGQLTGSTGYVELLPGSALFADRIVGDNHIIPELGFFSINNAFQSQMVLQRDTNIPIYGKASDGLVVTVEFAGQTETTTAINGEWQVNLSPVNAGGPYTLKIIGTDTFEFDDILMGDVWICGGQSNMALNVKVFRDAGYPEFADVPGDYQNDQIRLMRVSIYEAFELQDDIQIQRNWEDANSNSIDFFSATGYFFGKYLHEEVDVPLGLVTVARGGTGMGAFMPEDVVNANPFAANGYDYANMAGGGLSGPSTLYNAMVHPLRKQPIKGVIWYQGEHETINLTELTGFSSIFTDLINSWRNTWDQIDMPFIFTQLPGWGQVSDVPVEADQAIVRQQQLDVWDSVEHTGMAVSIDGGMSTDVHPPNKEDVGNRLALFARKLAYNEDIVYSGPKVREAVCVTQTNKAILKFKYYGEGLESRAITLNLHGPEQYNLVNDSIYGFELADSDNVFYNATAVIENDSVMTVTSPNVIQPTKVRFGWKAFPLTNLVNSEQLPATPFEMDIVEVESDNSLSINNFNNQEESNFKVYPTVLNKSGKFFIENKLGTPFKVEIRDAIGKILSKHESIDGSKLSIKPNNFNSGLYFVILKIGMYSDVERIIIN